MSNDQTTPQKKQKFHVTIIAYDDGTISVEAPIDFFIFRHIMCAAERVILEKIAEVKMQQQASQILRPTLKQIIPMTGKN